MNDLEVRIIEYLYKEGEADTRHQGYESGVFTAFPFELKKIEKDLASGEIAVKAACQNLSDNGYVSFDQEAITINEIGWAYYIDNHFKRS